MKKSFSGIALALAVISGGSAVKTPSAPAPEVNADWIACLLGLVSGAGCWTYKHPPGQEIPISQPSGER